MLGLKAWASAPTSSSVSGTRTSRTARLLVIGAVMTFEIFRFFKPENLLASPVTVSALFAVGMIVVLLRNPERIAEHPLFSWILVSAYIICGIMLCFPNDIVDAHYLYYATAIVVAGLSGIPFSLVMILGCFGIVATGYGVDLPLVLFTLLSLLTALNFTAKAERADFMRQTAALFAIEAVLVLLLRSFTGDESLLLKGLIVLGLFLVITVAVYLISSKDVILWSAFDYSIFDEEESPKTEAVSEEDENVTEYTITQLCEESAYYFRRMKARLPKTADRDLKTALLARKVAGYAGADLELVQAALMYRNIFKLAESDDKEAYLNSLKIPDRLKTMIRRENSADFRPSGFEEIIVYATFETVAAYHYFVSKNKAFAVDTIVDSICKLLLTKGIVRDSMLSMSMFHRMKQGLIDYFNEFFGKEENA